MKAVFNKAIFWLQRRPEFRFLSSVKLAIPLLLIVAAAVAWGTVVESKYNAEMAKIVVYNANWFSALTVLLWINIFCATVSRYPFRKAHTGFVITHLGLLMLLAGGVITTSYGIDGSMAVVEGQSENMVSLPKLVFGIAPERSSSFQTVEIPRTLGESDRFDGHNKIVGHIAKIEKYLPFAEVHSSFKTGTEGEAWALGFKLKSAFFNVAEFLHSEMNPSKQLGPALFELKVGKPGPPTQAKKAKSKEPTRAPAQESFQILSAKEDKVLHQIPVSELKKKGRIQFKNLEIELTKVFRSASVSGGGISENEGSKPNPALELNVKVGDKSYREVVFARFPGFSLAREPAHDFKFQYSAGDLAESSVADGAHGEMSGGQHQARFYIDESTPNQAILELVKDGQQVLQQAMKPGETVQTPWMGMQVTLASLIPKAEAVNEVNAIEPKQREDMPPGALMVRPKGSQESIWIQEGEAKDLSVNDRGYSLYFGRKMFRLPFNLNLKKFHKKDYPGTETAMSFESDVLVNNSGSDIKISMNEPLDHMGYTLYQSSYQLNPNGPAISIFSVNYDPGRHLKYFGSLVLCLGIVVFVIQRSSFYKNLSKRRTA